MVNYEIEDLEKYSLENKHKYCNNCYTKVRHRTYDSWKNMTYCKCPTCGNTWKYREVR